MTNVDTKEWLTIMVCMDASGIFIIYYYIFKRTYIKQDYVALCEPRAAMNVQENGWMTNDIFCDLLKHFQSYVPKGINRGNEHIIILDGHCSYVNPRAIDLSLQMRIDIMTILVHTSHKMQLLDVACFKPFKQFIQEEEIRFTLENPS